MLDNGLKNLLMTLAIYFLMLIAWPSSSPTDGILRFGIALIAANQWFTIDAIVQIRNRLSKPEVKK